MLSQLVTGKGSSKDMGQELGDALRQTGHQGTQHPGWGAE